MTCTAPAGVCQPAKAQRGEAQRGEAQRGECTGYVDWQIFHCSSRNCRSKLRVDVMLGSKAR